MISKLVTALQRIDAELTAEDIADVLWLALEMKKKSVESFGAAATTSSDSTATSAEGTNELLPERRVNAPSEQPALELPGQPSGPQPVSSGLYPGSSPRSNSKGKQMGVLPFRSPAATALPGSRDIARTLRPFRRRIPLPGRFVLNEEATAKRIAEEGLWVPVLDHASTNWLEVVLVVDKGASMTIWRQTISELHRLLARHGAFRDVRLWELDTNDPGMVRLYAGTGAGIHNRQVRSDRELIDTSGRRLILVVTDCVSPAWRSGSVAKTLEKWGYYNSVTIVQVLPQRLWSRTALGMIAPVRLHASTPGIPNKQLLVRATHYGRDGDKEPQQRVAIPIITLEPKPLTAWTRVIARAEDVWIPGFELAIPSQAVKKPEQNGYALYEQAVSITLPSAERVQRFRADASSPARRLAGLLATVPITLPIIRLIQQAMFHEPRQVHVAEVFLSGLLEVTSANSDTLDPDAVVYDFVDSERVRELLLNSVSPEDTSRVLPEISAFITSRFAHPLDFGALLADPLSKEGIVIDEENRPFALMGAKALRRFGGEYRELADWLEKVSSKEQGQVSNSLIDKGMDFPPRLLQQETVFSSSQVVEANDIQLGNTFDVVVGGTRNELENSQEEHLESQVHEPPSVKKLRKLLVITAGTIAAGVGIEFIKQMKEHPASELQAVVRYIDTAHLPTRYSGLRSGEWFQMTINPQFMDTVRRNPQNHPDLKNMLYPGFLPEIQGSGGGSIRYNAAGAIAINRRRIKDWLTTSITDLVRADIGQIELSIALVVSSVGATGSGSLEQLIDLVVDCAQTANIPSPLHCDVFILQPGQQGVTDLGLSNTLALYAEMAASRLAKDDSHTKSYRGRTLIVGWGSERYMSSIEQLKETAATLIRLTHDPATAIAAEFQEREVDNHVLHELDWQTQLPSHLSSATAVTISLRDLEEKIAQRDAVRLIDTLVFGGKPSETTTGEYFIPSTDRTEHKAGPLLNTLTDFLQGDMPEDRYRHLVGRLTEVLSIQSLQINATQLQGMNPQQQAGRLRGAWMYDKEEIIKSGRRRIQEQGAFLAGTALQDIIRSRRTAIANGLSLRDLRDEYQYMENIITSIISVQEGFSPEATDERDVIRKLAALERGGWGRERALQQAIGAVHGHLEAMLQRESHTAALDVLKLLQNHCAEALRNLEIVLGKLLRQRKNNPRWAGSDQKFRIDMNHLLHMAALSDDAEITRYADLVSIFASNNRRRGASGAGAGAIGRIVAGEQQTDQVGEFRKWLDEQGKLDALFAGEIDTLLDLAQSYASAYVHAEVRQHSVVDILLQTGEDVLLNRLKDAADKAHSLVPFSEQFASEQRAVRHVSAYWKDEEQRGILQKTIDQAFGQGQCTLLGSKDPSEIVVFYYVDGLPMSAISDLTGRCLDAFLKRRRAWERQSKTPLSVSDITYKQRIGVPVYSGRDAEQRVTETGVIRQLYNVRGQEVDTYSPEEISELADDKNRIRHGSNESDN